MDDSNIFIINIFKRNKLLTQCQLDLRKSYFKFNGTNLRQLKQIIKTLGKN